MAGVWAPKPKIDGDLSWSHVRNLIRYKMRAYASRSFLQEDPILFLNNGNATDARAYHCSHAVRIVIAEIQFCILFCHESGSFDIGILAAGDEKETLLVEHPANDRLLGWIPNTNEVLFISDRTGTWDCWIISVVDGKPAGKAQRILPGIGRVHPMGFTMDGIFYYGILYNTHLVYP